MINLNEIADGLYDQYEISEMLGVPTEEILGFIDSGQLLARRIGDKCFVKKVQLLRFVTIANNRPPKIIKTYGEQR
jgi:hypothetical protein